ncbi:ATP-binding cassette sub-family A member 7 [Durusdinium trenchii]|uniref:ATP-binding cassette sub-family A member 7 n=1 Tax=Durusdinium trenchii TaxID=1381693 RepID=A0ABP0N1V0_9DINO
MFSGTVWAGFARQIDAHNIPFSKELQNDIAEQLYSAFKQGKGQRDNIIALEGEDASLGMGKYLFEERNGQELGTSYGALSVSGEDGGQTNLTMWFKREAYHAVPAMVNLWNNARMQLLGMEGSKVQVSSHPLPKTQQLVQEEMSGGSQVLTDLFVALTVILAMGFIPASFLVYLVHEKSSNGKHQQLLTGVSPLMYWFGNYCWDLVNFLLPLVVCVLIFLSFQVMAYSGDNLPAIIVVLFLYGACMTPLMYCVEPLFRVPSTAYVTLICLNIFTGTISTLAIAVLEAFDQQTELLHILEFGRAVFPWVLPNYCLGRSLLAIAVNHYANFAYTEFGVCVHDNGNVCWKNPLSWDVTGEYLTQLAVMVPVWFLLRMIMEWDCLLRGVKRRFVSRALAGALATNNEDEVIDEAVVKEQKRVETGLPSDQADGLILDKLQKCFVRFRACRQPVTFQAVRGISVGVPAGECFGLLGVNGAGKTTTMRMITGDTEATKGDIFVGGASVQAQRDVARQRLGYCPQFDAIPDKLTVRETIQLFARIRGIPRGEVVKAADTMIARMCLEAHEKQLCEHLSGGNKRKLSTALALLGEPDVILLDEPSTGVDVGARRFLWEVIGDIRRSGHAVVLTSHSMEECEVLCSRLTVMVSGQFRCLGSPVELKGKYGAGYSLSVKCLPGQEGLGTTTEDNLAQIRAFVRKQVPWARLAEISVGLLRYHLGTKDAEDEELPLAEIFRTFEAASSSQLEGRISDYSISQTSLEEVFLHFSREAGVMEDPEIALEDVENPTTPLKEDPLVIGAPSAAGAEEPSDEIHDFPTVLVEGDESTHPEREVIPL